MNSTVRANSELASPPRPFGSRDGPFREAENFSLFLGGPLFQLLTRARLADDALRCVRRRILAFALITWLPLGLLTALEGNVSGAAIPLLTDFDVHIRFLVALPLMILAELVVHQRIRPVVLGFLERNLICEEDLSRFSEAVTSALRLRNSVVAEVVMLVVVYAVGVMYIWRRFVALDAPTWCVLPNPGACRFTLAGTWYVYVSLPIFQFILIRWYFRMCIWAQFLWRVSRIPLRLVPTHPDRLGGLGFLSNTVFAYALLAMAHGAVLAGNFSNRIFFLGASLLDFKIETATMIGALMCAVIAPLFVFTPQLAAAKRLGTREYGTLAERYVREFDRKWLRGGAPPDEPFVGTGDIQSLADLANSYEVVRGMRLAPVTRDAIVQLAAAGLAPLVPLLLTMMPLDDLLRKLFGILF